MAVSTRTAAILDRVFVCFIACNIDDRWHIFLWCFGYNSVVFDVCCDVAEFKTDALPQLFVVKPGVVKPDLSLFSIKFRARARSLEIRSKVMVAIKCPKVLL